MKQGTFRTLTTRRAFAQGILASSMAPYVLQGASAESAAKGRINVACIGLGGIMGSDLPAVCRIPGVNIVALCDVDKRSFVSIRERLKRSGVSEGVQKNVADAKDYTDYRRMLEEEKSLDAVIVATPDHWHAPLCTAMIQAGKHVFCEKPLTHTIGEARKLRQLVATSKVVTQMGNQGSASPNLRRNIELIQAGLLGQIHEVHVWHPPWDNKFCGHERPPGENPVPEGFDWDFWVGPAPMRPYINNAYHPVSWRFWYDFGNGSLGDFCCHGFNLAARALRLEYPTAIDVSGKGLGKESYITEGQITYQFPARGSLAPLTLHFYHCEKPPAHVVEGLKETFGSVSSTGCVLLGDKGAVSAGLWNNDGYLKMKGETKYRGLMNHEAAKAIPQTLPRAQGHMEEWIEACRGNGTTFSNFETGGHLTEIGLAGILALRAGHRIAWDGVTMKVAGMPELDSLIHPDYRKNGFI